MKRLTILILILISENIFGQIRIEEKDRLKEDLAEIISDITNDYIYLRDKEVNLDCIENQYGVFIDSIKLTSDKLLLFEYLLDEFYDSHLILNSNNSKSYRLYSPIYIKEVNEEFIIDNVWIPNTINHNANIIGASITKFNGKEMKSLIDEFPTHCHDKSNQEIRNWIANKILAGKYNQQRTLELKLTDKSSYTINIDSLVLKEENSVLDFHQVDSIGVITINNSLGQSSLIQAFDSCMDSLLSAKGIILDLRNTISGGNTYIARAILGRFISKPLPYQKHWTVENYGDHQPIVRSWVEYVSPRGKVFKKPLVIIVGRWTASMGEGLAIGFEGINRGIVIGTEMRKLAGAVEGFSFLHNNFGYQLSTEKLFHINGLERQNYIPQKVVVQTTVLKDEAMQIAIEHIQSKIVNNR